MNELDIVKLNPPAHNVSEDERQNIKFCYVPFTEFNLAVMPWKNEKGYLFYTAPCYCYSGVIPEIIKTYSFMHEDLNELINSEKLLMFNEKILNNDFSLCKNCPKFLNKNVGNWYGFKTLFDEEGCEIFWHLKNKDAKFPLENIYQLNLGINTNCNLACKTCRDNQIINDDIKITDEDIEKLTQLAKKSVELRFGESGELFASKNNMTILSNDLTENSRVKHITLFTNGTMINETNWNKIHLNNRKIIKEIKISVDAVDSEVYGKVRNKKFWDILIKNIKWLAKIKKDYNFVIGTTFTISRLNLCHLEKFYDFAKSLGFDYVTWNIVRPMFHQEISKDDSFMLDDVELAYVNEFIDKMIVEHSDNFRT